MSALIILQVLLTPGLMGDPASSFFLERDNKKSM